MNRARWELLRRIYDIGVRNDSMYFIDLDENFYKPGDGFNIHYLKEKELIISNADTDGCIPTNVDLTVEAIDLLEPFNK